MNKEIKDICGNVVKVGDLVAVSEAWATSSSFLKIGRVEEIKYTPNKTKAVINLIRTGQWNYGKSGKDPRYPKKFVYEIPRVHDNIIIVK